MEERSPEDRPGTPSDASVLTVGTPALAPRPVHQEEDPAQTIVDLCRHFYTQGWVSGTGGGISIRRNGRVWLAPSGVMKERMQVEDIFVLDDAGQVLQTPTNARLRQSQCKPLFFEAFRARDAGAVLHSHSLNAMLVTMLVDRELHITRLEMLKGLHGVGYDDDHVVPVIENTAHECDLADSLGEAIRDYPKAHAVLVRRHGVYVWGRDWVEAKTHAECYDYLFAASIRMHELGLRAGTRRLAP